MTIDTLEDLRTLYGFAKERAKDKQLPALEKHSKNFIEQSSFVVISTFDRDHRVDVSPRGGAPGFVHIIDDVTLALPDAHGNKRLDCLVNILETGRIGTLFLIPGVDETLRVNGRAELSKDENLLTRFASEIKTPASCIVLHVEEVFLHCAKALMRSNLWSADAQIERSALPTLGRMINDQLDITTAPETQEAMIERYQDEL